MSPSEANTAPRRKHTTTACTSCRESKIKCDGAFPTCASCQTRGKPCQYQVDNDKRRLSHRLVIELLSDRVDELAHFIQANSLDLPPMHGEKHTSLMKTLGHLRLSDAVANKDGLSPVTSPGAVSSRRPTDQSPAQTLQDPTSSLFDFQGDLSTTGHPGTDPYDNTSNSSHPLNLQAPLQPISEMNMPLDENLNHHLPPSSEDEAQAPSSYSPYPRMGWSNIDLSLLHMTPTDFAGFGALPNFGNSGATPHQPHAPPAPPPPRDRDVEKTGADSTDSMEVLVRQLSDRIGALRIGAGGQVHYYGPTSNFNLVDMGLPDNLTVHRSVRHDGPMYLDRLNMGKHVPQELEDHLMNLYFAWQDPAFHVVKRGMYERAKVQWRDGQEDTPYFSEALQNALCSLGAAFEARHYPKFTTYPKSLADFFADRAKTLLEIELDSPCIATVQALIILSGHDIGCKRDSRGWLYSGMATRLAFHLALHLDMTTYVTSNSITQEEVDLRRDVFWAAYTVDQIWSFHLGRAFRVNMESVTVGLPDAEQSVDAVGEWIPYLSARSLNIETPVPDHTVALHRQRVMLCEIMAPLGFALYGNLQMPPSALHELNISTVSKLMTWKANLPLVLQVDIDDHDSAYLPHVLLLHMLFHQNIIYAHRPWMSRRSNIFQQPYLNEGHNAEHARAMCFESAISIAKLLQIYEATYGLRRINIQAVGITCSAALLLIFAVVIRTEQQQQPEPDRVVSAAAPNSETPSANSSNPVMHLGTCFNALDEFGSAWESAKKARDFLNLLQRRWEIQARKLRPPRARNRDVVPTKRQRTTNEDVDSMRPRSRRAWSGTEPSQGDNPLDGIDVSADLGWILMDGELSPPNNLIRGQL